MSALNYTIEINNQGDRESINLGQISEQAAIDATRKEAAKYSDARVCLSWSRASDGQRAYLNPSGNHDIVGIAY